MTNSHGSAEAGRRPAADLGHRAHPLLFALQHAHALLTRFDGVGMRGLLQEHAREVLEPPCPGRAAHEDLDTPEDYSRWHARLNDPP